jgi:hypothetical protein
MQRRLIVGVMGGGSASAADCEAAYRLGRLIAEQGWVLLNGGRNAGIMAASARGAAEQGGITVGILPDDHKAPAAAGITIPIPTGMGSARNVINVLASDIVVACPGGAGTVSEVALALKHGKTVILLEFDTGKLFSEYRRRGRLLEAASPEAALEQIQAHFAR